jgi:hypothetical protein
VRSLIAGAQSHCRCAASPPVFILTASTHPHRRCASLPVRSLTAGAQSHCRCAASPPVFILTASTQPRRRCSALPLVHSLTAGAQPHRRCAASLLGELVSARSTFLSLVVMPIYSRLLIYHASVARFEHSRYTC